MTIDNELINNLLKNYKKPEELIGENGLLKQLTKQLLERAMAAELTEHVGYDKHDVARRRGIGMALSSRRSSRNIRRDSPASTRTSFRCMRAGFRPERSHTTSKRSTMWKFR